MDIDDPTNHGCDEQGRLEFSLLPTERIRVLAGDVY